MNKEKIQSPENISFKKVTSDDWKKFREIRLKGLQTDPQAFGETFENESQKNEDYWKEKFLNPEQCFYVAEEGGEFIATTGSKKIAEDNWMIIAVYVSPEFRGKNISQELINRIIDEAKNNGAVKVSLMVNPIQKSAVRLYEKMGFKIVKIEKDQKMGDGRSYDEYYMEKVADPKASN